MPFLPGVVASAHVVPAVPTFRSISAVGTNNATVTKPAGLTVGDLIIILYEDDGAHTGTLTGWSAVPGTPILYNTSLHSLGALWKIATSTETAATNFTVAGLTGAYKETVAIAYSGATQINVVGLGPDTSTTPSVTTTVSNCVSITAVAWDGASINAAAPATWTRRLNGSSSYDFYIAERLEASAGATGTTSFSTTGSATVGTLRIAIAP